MKSLNIKEIKKNNYGDLSILLEIKKQLADINKSDFVTKVYDFIDVVIEMNSVEVDLESNNYGLDLKLCCDIQDNYISLKGKLAEMLTEEFGIENIWNICYE